MSEKWKMTVKSLRIWSVKLAETEQGMMTAGMEGFKGFIN
jgi:hypothetical protein